MAVVLSDITPKGLMLCCNGKNALIGNFMTKRSKRFICNVFPVSDHLPLIS